MKSLFVICILSVLCGIAVSLVRDYIFNPQAMKWTAAQDYCKQHNGNLAIITTEEEQQTVVTVKQNVFVWIGMNRTVPHVNNWKWVDEEEVNFTKWNLGEPNDWRLIENCVVTNSNGWYDTNCDSSFSSVCCRSFMLVNERNTWDEALKHCRKDNSDLAFVDSGTLLDLLKTKADHAQTASVWTGMRYLDGQWFWLNGKPLGSLVSLPSCPAWPYRCGAYNVNINAWENRDCNEQLNFLCFS